MFNTPRWCLTEGTAIETAKNRNLDVRAPVHEWLATFPVGDQGCKEKLHSL